MALFIQALCIVLYAVGALFFLLGFIYMREKKHGAGPIILLGFISAVPVLVGALLQSVLL